MGASAGQLHLYGLDYKMIYQIKKLKIVLRESTKVSCIVGIAAAHSLNLIRWKDMANVDEAYLKSIFEKYLGKMDTEKWMERSFNKNYISEVDFFEKMDSNDPPIFIINYGKNTKPKEFSVLYTLNF